MCGGGRLHPDVVQDVADFGAVGDEGNDAHLPTAHGAQQRKCLVDGVLGIFRLKKT